MHSRRRLLLIALIAGVVSIPLIYVSYLGVLAYTPSLPKADVETVVIGFEDGTKRLIDPSTSEGRKLHTRCRNALCHVDGLCTCFIRGSDVVEQVELNSSYVKIVYSEAKRVSFFGIGSLVNYKPDTTEVWFFLSGRWKSRLLVLNGYSDRWEDTIWGMYYIKNIDRWIQT